MESGKRKNACAVLAKWITDELRSHVESVERRLSHALDYLVFWSMHKGLAELPNRAFDVCFLLLCVWGVLGSHPHYANAKRQESLCSAHHTHFLLVQKCHIIQESHMSQPETGKYVVAGASWEAVPAWTGRLGLPEITTGGVRNHNHIVLVMLGHCSLAHSHSLLQKQ